MAGARNEQSYRVQKQQVHLVRLLAANIFCLLCAAIDASKAILIAAAAAASKHQHGSWSHYDRAGLRLIERTLVLLFMKVYSRP